MPDFKPHWYFGDGEESTEYEPVHIYKMAGEYEVLLVREFDSGTVTRNTFTIYVYEWAIGEGLHVVYTNRSIRDAIIPMQGVGMAEWGGDEWLWPEAYVGTCNGYAKNNDVVSLVMDTHRGRHYRIGIREQWLDRLDNLGYTRGVGHEITCRWSHKEYVSSRGEYEDVRHIESHCYLRPYLEEYRNQEGYQNTGFREGFQLTARLYLDGELDFETEANDIPRLADIVFPKEVKGPRIKTEFETNTSGFRCIGVQQQIEENDQMRGPEYNTKTEVLLERDFAQPDFWISRDSVTPIRNRVTGNNVDGSIDSLITGPEGVSNSGMFFNATTGLSFELSLLGEHTLSWWNNGIIADSDIWVFGTQRISLEYIGNQYNLVLFNGDELLSVPIRYQGDNWALIIVKFLNNQVRIYRNKEDFGLRNYSMNYSGNTTFMNNVVGEAFDIRRIPRDVSTEALNYYFDTVIRDNGTTGFLPNMR